MPTLKEECSCSRKYFMKFTGMELPSEILMNKNAQIFSAITPSDSFIIDFKVY